MRKSILIATLCCVLIVCCLGFSVSARQRDREAAPAAEEAGSPVNEPAAAEDPGGQEIPIVMTIDPDEAYISVTEPELPQLSEEDFASLVERESTREDFFAILGDTPAWCLSDGFLIPLRGGKDLIVRIDGQGVITEIEYVPVNVYVEQGDSCYSVHKQLSGRLIIDGFFCLAWENAEDYVLAVLNNDRIAAYVRFSKDMEPLEEVGIETVPDPEPEEWIGKTEEELISALGPYHFDAGSGLYIPSYVSRTGKVYSFIVYSGVVEGVGVKDLASGDPAEQATGFYFTVSLPAGEGPAWKICTVRVINYLHGTEFTVLHPDGSYAIYGTSAICSLSAFRNGVCPMEEIRSGRLSDEELAELQTLLASLYRDGQMLPVEEDWDQYFEFEASYVYVSVDDSEEAFFLKGYGEWEDYPPKEYDELIRLVHSLYPESWVLHGRWTED